MAPSAMTRQLQPRSQQHQWRWPCVLSVRLPHGSICDPMSIARRPVNPLRNSAAAGKPHELRDLVRHWRARKPWSHGASSAVFEACPCCVTCDVEKNISPSATPPPPPIQPQIPETWILGWDSRRVLCHASSDVGCDAGWGTGRVNDGPWGHFWLGQRERCKTASGAELTTEVANRCRTQACTHTKLSKRMCQAKAQGERSCEIQIRCDCVRYWKKAVLAWRLLSCCDKHLFVEHEISVVAHWISAGFDNYTNRKKTSTCRPMRKIEVKVSTKRQNIQNIEQRKSDKLFDASTSKKRKERNTGVTKAWQMFRACMYPLHKTNWNNEKRD